MSEPDDPREQLLAINGQATRTAAIAGYLIDALAGEQYLPTISRRDIQGPYDISSPIEEFRQTPHINDLRDHGRIDANDVEAAIDDLNEADISVMGFSVLADGEATARAVSDLIDRKRAALDEAAAALDGIHRPALAVSISEDTPLLDSDTLVMVTISYPNLSAVFGVDEPDTIEE